MKRQKTGKKRDKRTLGENDLKYLTFIDELRKNVRLDSPTAEISRMYKEVIDVLTEAFDEYEPSDLPKYEKRIEYIIELSESEPSLSDPLFKEDLQKAKGLLQTKIQERWGFYEKLKHVGSVFARNVGGLTAIGQEALDLYDRASNIGQKFGSIGGAVSRKVDDEETRRIHDLLKGNQGQYGDTPSMSTSLVTTDKNIIAVKDDKLIGTNTTQNKVLNSLLVVTRDSNKDIKEIKKLLQLQEQRKDDQEDDTSLQNLEDKQEQEGPEAEVKTKKGLLQALAGVFGGGNKNGKDPEDGKKEDESSISGMLWDAAKETALYSTGGWAAGKTAKWLWGLLKGAPAVAPETAAGTVAAETAAGTVAAETAAGTVAAETAAGTTATGIGTTLAGAATAVASSPAALVAGGAAAGAGLAYLTVPPAMKGVRSLAATIGEKRQGINYYKGVFKYELDDETREKAETWALNYLYKDAVSKQERFENAFRDGSIVGDGSYLINGKPAKRDEAEKDIQAAVDIYNKYNEYLQEKGKKGGLTATAVFQGSNGKVYQNPLYGKDELQPKGPGEAEVAPVQNANEFVSGEKTQTPKQEHEQRRERSRARQHKTHPAEVSDAKKTQHSDSTSKPSEAVNDENSPQFDFVPSNPVQNLDSTGHAAEIVGDRKHSPFGDSIKHVPSKEPSTYSGSRNFGPNKRFGKNEDSRIEAEIKEDILSKPKQEDGSDKEITGSSFKEKAPVVMERLMKDLNISQEDAAAIVGNLGHESAGLKPDINEGKPVVPGSRGGYGWAQWTGPRRRQFEEFAKENDLDISSDEANYQFLVHELKTTEKKSLDALRNAEGLEEKTVAFEGAYERAGIKHHDKRVQYAQKANDHFNSADVDLDRRQTEQVMLARNEVELEPKQNESVENAVSRLSRDGDASKGQPIVISQNTPPAQTQQDSSSISTKQVGAPSNGVSESTYLLALRHNLSPVTS